MDFQTFWQFSTLDFEPDIFCLLTLVARGRFHPDLAYSVEGPFGGLWRPQMWSHQAGKGLKSFHFSQALIWGAASQNILGQSWSNHPKCVFHVLVHKSAVCLHFFNFSVGNIIYIFLATFYVSLTFPQLISVFQYSSSKYQSSKIGKVSAISDLSNGAE